MKDYEHLIRVGAVFILVFGAFLTARRVLTPDSYGKTGRYRAASVDENKALPLSYAGKSAQRQCSKCHDKQYKEKISNSHKAINEVGISSAHSA